MEENKEKTAKAERGIRNRRTNRIVKAEVSLKNKNTKKHRKFPFFDVKTKRKMCECCITSKYNVMMPLTLFF